MSALPTLPDRARVVVVGGGVIGCAAADELQRAGATVTLCERCRPGDEASCAAAGVLSPLGGSSRTTYGALAMTSWRMYPEVAADLERRTGIDVELALRGCLHPLLSAAELREAEAICRWPDAEELGAAVLDGAALFTREPAVRPDAVGALFIAREGWLNNQRLAAAYAAAASVAGVTVRAGSTVSRVLVRHGRVAGVMADGDEMEADVVLLAAGAWSGELAASFGARLPVGPSRGQMLALANEPPLVRHCLHGDEVYLVPRANGELLVGATVERAGFARQVTAGGIAQMLQAAIALVPDLAGRAISRTWCGFRPQARDGLPVLGPWPDISGLYVATGHHRNGILLAPITARLMREWILKGEPSIAVPEFLPDRFVARR